MDYEKKYKEALERARGMFEQGMMPERIEYIFPELKESEDERIRKNIISFLRSTNGYMTPNEDWDFHARWIPWLEKQSQVKESLYSQQEIDETCIEHNDSLIEKQGEQKPADKVEPKFKVWDWINGYYTSYKVLSVNNEGYVVEDVDGNIINILFENEKFHHLWTIQDAKDGDLIYVSTEDKGIQAIFHKFENGIIYFHCYLCRDFTQGGYMPIGSVELVFPLQKTHYKRFFQEMHEAGYEWDAEKLELRKIEQKQVEHWQYVGTVELGKDEENQKPAEWSEEDERIRAKLLSYFNGFEESTSFGSREVNEIRHWLKSIRFAHKQVEI